MNMPQLDVIWNSVFRCVFQVLLVRKCEASSELPPRFTSYLDERQLSFFSFHEVK